MCKASSRHTGGGSAAGVTLSQAALREPVADAKPVNIMQKSRTPPTTSLTAERSCTTPLVTPASRRPGRQSRRRRAMCRWSCEERARAPRTALWGRVGWVGLGVSAA
eukprot:1508625-Prymnesium_polylepis.1